MNITDHFIKHPVAAVILNAAIILVGILSFYSLSLREYPEVIIPKITVMSFYPNASSELVETSVTNALEDELAGVEGLDEMTSQSQYGQSIISMTFKSTTSMDRALIAVKDAVGLAKAKLPTDVKDPIVQTGSGENGVPFMAACLETDSMTPSELTHYVNTSLKNGFRSIKGVASAQVWGTGYTYQVTLDHKAMYSFGINADEIFNAIDKSSNLSLPAGKFQNETPVTIVSDLKTDEDMRNILIRDLPEPLFLKHLAKIELIPDTGNFRMKLNGKPGVCIGVNKTSDDNPLDTSRLVHEYVDMVKQTLPETIKMDIFLDQADFVRTSIKNIKSSIIEAIVLVLIIVFLFLRNVKATLIPIITIPISLLGAMLFLKMFGFSINIMTLLAMVLAVGLVVDDAIVVLENIARHIEEGVKPLNAALVGAKEIGFAVVAMTLTLTSVYAPIAFISGLTGQLFIEFAAALAGSVLISGVTAITLSPLMCAKLLKPKQEHLLPQFDVFLEKMTNGYSKILHKIIHFKKLIILFVILAIASMFILFKTLPSEITPKEDRGITLVWVTALPNQSMDGIESNVNKVEEIVKTVPESWGTLSFVFGGGGMVIPILKPIDQRVRSSAQIAGSLYPLMTSFPSFDAYPSSIDTGLPGLDNGDNNNDLTMMVSTVDSYDNLLKELDQTVRKANDQKLFASVKHNLKMDNLGYNIKIDKHVMSKMQLQEAQISKAIEIFFSGNKTLEFKKDNILYPINIEGDVRPWNLDELYITNILGQKISVGTLAKLDTKQEPSSLDHYNQMRSAKLIAELTEGDNLEKSIDKLGKFANENLPSGYQKAWTGIAKTYAETAATLPILFLLAMLFIYGILAVQFDNFIDPLIILFTVPLACSGALFVMSKAGVSLNIYSQVGLITLIGLITKHGILIVEFANKLQQQGESLINSIEKAASLRLRPILMTTGAMVAGSIPLIISSSSGHEVRYAIGVVLISGLTIGTIFTLFVLPSLYYMIKSLKNHRA